MNGLCKAREIRMSNPVIVVHYHELWLKGRNRRFFLGKLFTALRQALQGIPVERIEQPGRLIAARPLLPCLRAPSSEITYATLGFTISLTRCPTDSTMS